MLSKSETAELREMLERSQRPLFLYDNDADGLCSFLLFWRFLKRGVGIAVRSYPALDEAYSRYVSQSFFSAVGELGVPVIWVDHHPQSKKSEGVTIFNWASEGKAGEPVTYV